MSGDPRFQIRPSFYPGAWLTEHHRYYEYLRLQLTELETLQGLINSAWPQSLGAVIRGDEYPDLHHLCRRRDALKDSIVVFAAMTAEATINLYGVRRFGEKHYQAHFERLSLERKLQLLLLLCDGIDLSTDALLLKHARSISSRRNSLVHPKAREAPDDAAVDSRSGRPCIDVAREAIAECDSFLAELFALIPGAADIDPRASAA